MRFLPLIAPLALVVAACSSMPDAESASTQVDVTAAYRERIMLTPGHVLTVKVEDVSLMDAPARVMAQTSQPLDGRGPPYAVTLSVPNSQIDARHTYAVRAEIRDPAGALRFTTDTRHSVLTNGAPNKADIIMVGVR
ncbi:MULTISPECIES: YbaY family lipoprotein [Brevundimonas]|jgi:putative lipoprotein|uniref:YbaY family lipoprotein n=1 Tax=Brevundimonas TaxID=41275 RepID=UPI000E0C3CD3|nr:MULTISPECIES: YbaY family lipoprotein [Brevundimonas]MBD3833090.1 YbaY family lipoprotein [Brevundimonas sp.]NWE52791.1 YbaY family lipoprotein [Brevundimonas sp. P7753]WQE38139.1 YbaY family lipoprotein [Brevundimonas bullata]